MNASLYECSIVHRRFAPTRHEFAYRIFFLSLDLRRLARDVRNFRLFSLNRWNLYSFRPHDYLPDEDAPRNDSAEALCARIESMGASHGVDLRACDIELLTLPRVCGYAFNPVSFYFCRGPAGEPLGAIVEVTNTFREVKPYWLGPEHFQGGSFRRRVPKHFYVSPFSDVDVAFQFALRPPAGKLGIEIDDYTGPARTLASTLRGERRPFTDSRLLWYLLKYPAVTLKVIALIHWHALRLYLKRTPWFRKDARGVDQRDLFRAHQPIRLKTSR